MESFTCTRCARNRSVTRRFAVEDERRCLRCALRHAPMLRRSFFTALVVGTLLTLINQGSTLAQGNFSARLYWTIPVTYCVPFLVATWGALGNARQRP